MPSMVLFSHDDVIKWKHFPCNRPFVRGIHRSPVNSPHKGQWHGALMFSLICVWINYWVNNGEAGDLRRYRVHCDVIVMSKTLTVGSYNMRSRSMVKLIITVAKIQWQKLASNIIIAVGAPPLSDGMKGNQWTQLVHSHASCFYTNTKVINSNMYRSNEVYLL